MKDWMPQGETPVKPQWLGRCAQSGHTVRPSDRRE